jgi:hypothetical protein
VQSLAHVPYYKKAENKAKEKKMGILAKKCKEYFYI